MIGRQATAETLPILTSAPPRVELPRINLLPAHVIVLRRLRRVQAGLGGGVLVAILLMLGLMVMAAGQQAAEQRRLDAAESRNAALQREAAGFVGVKATYTAVDNARATLRAALTSEVRYSRLLAAMSTHVPASVQVTTLAYTQGAAGAAGGAGPAAAAAVLPGVGISAPVGIGTVTVGGLAASYDDLVRWLESLSAQTGLASPVVSTSTKADVNGRSVVTFQSSAVLTASALSQRYAGPDGGLK